MPTGIKHVDRVLSNLSLEYRNDEQNFIADDVFPLLPVAKSSDKFFIHTTDFRLPETVRAYGTASKQVTWGLSTASYQLAWHSLADTVADKDRENYDPPIQANRDTTEFLTNKMMLRKEKEAAKVLFTTTSWGNNRTITATAAAWHTSTAYPVQAVLSGGSVILQASGGLPNTGVMGYTTYLNTRENTNITDRYKYTRPAIITAEMLAALFDLKKMYVGQAVIDETIEGASEDQGFVWGDGLWIGYVAGSPLGRKTKSSIARIQRGGRVVKTWRDEAREGDMIEVNEEYQFRVMASASGYFIKSPALG